MVESEDYIGDFFAQYPNFNYDFSKSVMAEFYRMCDEYDWDRDDPEREEAREGIKDAMTRQFNIIYGTDENSLPAWQNLCSVLNLPNIPNKLGACRDVSIVFTYV